MPPKAKKKKITWCNSSCKADKCLEPPSKSIWLNCDVCGYWYHEDCIGVKAEDYPEDLEFYCFKCHPAKLEEYDSLKAKLLIKVRELAEAQKDFKGPTISRDMFKEKKNAGQYNFSSDFPPTLTDLCLRINGQYKTFGDFKHEATQWVNRLKELLLEKYESDLQYIDWEFQDFVEDLLKGEEEEEEEPDDASSEEQQAALDAELLALNDTFDEELDVESTNKSFEHTVIKTEIPDEYLEDFVRVVPSVGKCQNCSTDITDINVTIYLCKRKHKICQDCRVINPGRICPTCHDVHGDRKRLMKDSVFQNDIKAKKVRKRKSPDNALPKIGDSWSCTATSSNANPSRIPPSPQSSLDTSIVDVMSVPIKQEPDLIQENLFSSEDQHDQDEGSACAIQSVRSLNPFSWNPPDLSASGGTELIEADFNITSLAEVATNELVRLTDATGPSIQLQENVMFSEDVVVQHDSHLQGFNKLVPKFPSLSQDFQENVILTEVLDVPESDEGMNHHVLEPQTMDPYHALQQCSNQELQQCSDQELLEQAVTLGAGRWVRQAEFLDEIENETMDLQYGMAVWNTPQNVNIVDSQTVSVDGYIRVQGNDIKLPQKPVQIGQPIVVQTRSLEESRQMKGLNSMLSKIPSSILDKIPNTEPHAPQHGETSLSTVWNADSFVQSHPMPIPRGSPVKRGRPVKSSTQQVQNNQAVFQRSSRSQNRLAAQGATQVPSQTQQQKLGLQLVNTSKLLESGN